MPETGKIDDEFFAEYIATRLGATRDDVRKGPAHGVDFGVVDVGEHALAIATDPLSILPELGFERAARFALRIILADVAVSGLAPSHLSVSFGLPPDLSDEEFATVWGAIDEECRDLGVSVVTGHTARYAECSFPWVGHGTALAVGNPAEIIYPDGTQPGDTLLVTRGPAVETTGLLTTLFPDQIPVEESTLDAGQACLEKTDAVRDATALADISGVHAMHDATEGGVLGALHEMSQSAGVKLAVETETIPQHSGVMAVADALGFDPWRATTSGTLVVAVEDDSAEQAVTALESRGTSVGVAGTATTGRGVVVDDELTTRPESDSSWPVYERLLAADGQ
jgi:hydrogenase maturation factor